MATVTYPAPAHESSGHAYGNLIDLARLRMGSAHAQVCEVCNTINRDSARLCKCCAYKLPAFYASASVSACPGGKAVRAIPPRKPTVDWWATGHAVAMALCGRFADYRRGIHRFLVVHFAPAAQALQ
ncbi:hypothetical protein ACIPRI_24145 [Variovorax sp. LARHSF232]